MTFEFEERQGSLIDSVMPTDSIVLGMTEDMKLLNKDIRSRLSQPQQLQKKKVGQVAIHQHQKRFIFYLITRQKSYNKPTYAQLEACLIELRKTCESYNVQSLALPRELEEGLQEKYVKQALFDVFQGWPEKEPFLPSISPPLQPQPKKLCCLKKKLAALVCTLLFAISIYFFLCQRHEEYDFSHLKKHCKHIQPIPAAEYAARHRRLYETLVQLDKEAFVMEGGATMRYYSNIDWELTERPFLVVLRRQESLPTGINMTIITPTFEFTKAAERFKEARLPKEIQPTFVSWDEHKSPFEPIKSIVQEGSLLVEPTTRLFIFQGLEEEHLNVQIAPISIRQLRMIKSPSELNILRCANTVTEMAIRAVRPHVKVGMSEQELQVIMTKALTAAGLSQTWVLALIDQHAALPHGDSSEKQVKEDSVILIDTGGELFGYQSDTTRTFFLGQKGFNQTVEDAWYLVKKAQENVLDHLKAGMTAAQVDLTARHVIENGGYGSYFTHRLGHGIGLEMHEEPYMNKGNTDLVLRPGMTFSVEPGIYIVNEFGIRLEDIVVINEQGQLELLTNGLAQDPWSL